MPTKNPSTTLRAGIIPGQRVTKEKLERSRGLRREMTPSERILWNELRGNKLGVHFRRQQVIAGFIVDFYCHKTDLVIEVDGSVHEANEQKEKDTERDKVLSKMGLRVFRIKNEDVIKNLSRVLEKIRELVSE